MFKKEELNISRTIYESGGVKLEGLIFKPNQTGKFPGVVFIHASIICLEDLVSKFWGTKQKLTAILQAPHKTLIFDKVTLTFSLF
ncbi:MAG: hypothetical protein AAB584_02055 [Patescibacteria group bacterium]